ncbi:unnamed protein product [Pleuronectes platessa]|uniref:Uncharacterized protein n=1 Tax=Pleuronectes platessa TaxID=8262 RepID=A0A9N7YWQ7_PLEPL|nr:unnamed protein product [Pleuronectes platessa]
MMNQTLEQFGAWQTERVHRPLSAAGTRRMVEELSNHQKEETQSRLIITVIRNPASRLVSLSLHGSSPTADRPSAEIEDSSLHDHVPPALSPRPPAPHRQERAETAAQRFASCANPLDIQVGGELTS